MKTIKLQSGLINIFARGLFNGIIWLFKTIFFFVFMIFKIISGGDKKEEFEDKIRKRNGQMTSDEELKAELYGKKDKVKLWDLLRPWHLTINLDFKNIIVTKRNWYLIGVKENTYAFNSIRQIEIKNNVIDSDVYIRIFGGFAVLKCFSKSDAKYIKDTLMNTEWIRNDRDAFADNYTDGGN
jgi:hypothetical protein